MADLDLFGAPGEGARNREGSDGPESESPGPEAPLAARMRPRSLDEFRGQGHLLAEGKALRAMLDRGEPASMILWGPPGSGKTTLARLLASTSSGSPGS